MARAEVDPDELRKFARNLKQFNAELESCLHRVRGQFQALSGSWRDDEYRKFAESFEHMVLELRRYVQTSDAFIPVLDAKAQLIEEYLRR